MDNSGEREMKIVVTKNAVRELLREAMMNPSVGWQSTTDLSDSPSTVSAVVDPSAAVTDPGNLNFKPSNRKELSVAISSIIDDISDDRAENIFDAIKDAIRCTIIGKGERASAKRRDEKEVLSQQLTIPIAHVGRSIRQHAPRLRDTFQIWIAP